MIAAQKVADKQRKLAAMERERATAAKVSEAFQRKKAKQAEIARLEGMGRVKAHRALQKMQEKNLVEIIPYGKIRKIILKDNIRNSLTG